MIMRKTFMNNKLILRLMMLFCCGKRKKNLALRHHIYRSVHHAQVVISRCGISTVTDPVYTAQKVKVYALRKHKGPQSSESFAQLI